MRVTFIAVGTRGDVQPMFALAAATSRAGHAVRFAGEKPYQEMCGPAGVEFHEIDGDSAKFYAGPAGVALRERMEKPVTQYRRFWNSYLVPSARHHLSQAEKACPGSELLVCQSQTGMGPTLSEYFGIPCVVASVFPVWAFPAREFPHPFWNSAQAEMSPERNWRSWRRSIPLLRIGEGVIQDWRESLGLRREDFRTSMTRLRQTPHLLGYSPLVVPRSAEWPEHVNVAGYWFQDAPCGYEPPEDLKAFLANGEPPVVIGFGSHVGRNPAKLTRTVVDALQRAGERGILILGWGGMKAADLPASVFPCNSIPFDRLLPGVKALVHHGGSGTAAIALRMGCPQIITPFGYDMTFWGHRIADLGVGSRPLPLATLEAGALAQAIREAIGMKARAMEVASLLNLENGMESAVTVLERVAGSRTVSCVHS